LRPLPALLAIGVAVTEIAVWGRRQQLTASNRAGYIAGIGAPARLEQVGEVTMPHQARDADRDGLPSSIDTELLTEADGFLQGRFLMTPLPGAHPTRAQRLVAVALADQAGAALASSRRRRAERLRRSLIRNVWRFRCNNTGREKHLFDLNRLLSSKW
jgi:hypothetical protein